MERNEVKGKRQADNDFKGFCEDPGAWRFTTLCDECLNRLDGGTCDIFDWKEQGDRQFKCDMFLKKE